MTQILWIETARKHALAARLRVQSHDSGNHFFTAPGEREMDAVQVWCRENECGRRISFDTFQFRNRQEITLFLLRWG